MHFTASKGNDLGFVGGAVFIETLGFKRLVTTLTCRGADSCALASTRQLGCDFLPHHLPLGRAFRHKCSVARSIAEIWSLRLLACLQYAGRMDPVTWFVAFLVVKSRDDSHLACSQAVPESLM